jgi:REP element-mobilizing transposase RayT
MVPLMRQTHFSFADKPAPKLTHGGSNLPKKRKGARPLCEKSPLHLVMKCNQQIFEQRDVIIDTLVPCAHKFGIPIYSFAIGHDHIHFITKVPSREAYVKFIRALTGMLAKLLGAKLFASMAYTRIATWGRDYFNLLRYMQQNWDEACGRVPYKPRGRKRNKPAKPTAKRSRG